MTIIEAIQSGKQFRRASTFLKGKFLNIHDDHICYESACAKAILVSELLATDWEIEESKVEVTREKLRAAYVKMAERVRAAPHLSPMEELCKELGL